MAAVELDPLFVKALKLLQSKAKDSSAQLKSMLDDAIAQRKGLKLPSQSGEHEKSILSKTKSDTDLKRKEGEKRSHDKTLKDSFEPDVKRSKFEQLKQQKDKEVKDREREKIKKEKERKEKEEVQRQKDKAERERKEKEMAAAKQEPEVISDEEEAAQQIDAGDFAIDLGLACVVCRQFDVSSGNQLIECQECHSLYHQECHKPTVTEQDVSDPRFVWYCSRCTKSFKKMMAQKPIKPSKTPVPLTSTKESTSAIITKTNKTESDSGSQAFRRLDPKAIVTPKDTGSLSSSSKAMVGLAGLAANLTKPRGDSKSSSSSKKSSSEHKGDTSKSSSKTEVKISGSKPESLTKQSPSLTKSDSRKTESSKSSSSGKEESREGKKSESKSGKSDSSSRKDDRKEKSDSSGKSSKEEKKSDKPSPKHSSSNNSPPTTPVSTDASCVKSSSVSSLNNSSVGSVGGGGSSLNNSSVGGGGSSNNKQAVANLSMVTANKRIQMMKKKAQAQTKPQEKRVHIK